MTQIDELERFDRRVFVRRAAIAAATIATLGPKVGLAQDKDKDKDKAKDKDKPSAARPLKVRVWAEGTAPRSVYPHDIDGAISDYLRRQSSLDVQQARLADADAGLSDESLDSTDVLIWWGRLKHADLPEARARAIVDRVKAGRLGFVALHASWGSKPFLELMGCSCEPGDWRDDGKPERVTVKDPDHEIARGVVPFTIPKAAMYAEPFQVPKPDAVVFVSEFDGNVNFRSGLTWTVGKGRVVYFRPGHDAFPVFFHPSVRRVIANAARWAAPTA